MLKALIHDIRSQADPVRAKSSLSFFKTGKGEYGEGDQFLGLTVPVCRSISRKYLELNMSDLDELIRSPYHEERLIALIILVGRFEHADKKEQTNIFKFYVKHAKWINNWDLVDVSAPNLLGAYLLRRDRSLLFKMAKSTNLWKRRMAIVATYYFIKQHECGTTLRLAELLLRDRHDLIHKATGWMLREVGKISVSDLASFLREHAADMPRTMLRYAIEKFPEEKRKAYLAGKS
jgi:3-methyladenine DNA glycosylase AlkD